MNRSGDPEWIWREEETAPCHEYQLCFPEHEKFSGRHIRMGMICRGKELAYEKGDVSFLTQQGFGERLYGLQQCHGSELYEMQEDPQGHDAGLCDLASADALIAPYQCLGQTAAVIKTADCAPIVVLGNERCALIHAGWRGLASGIIKKTVGKLSNPIAACVFPAARSCCYEIGVEVQDAIGETAVVEERGARLYLDVSRTAYQQLLSVIPAASVYVSPHCTICDTRFHSYRREKDSCGHNYSYLQALFTE